VRLVRSRLVVIVVLAFSCIALNARLTAAQNMPKGYVSLFGDYFPNRDDTTELRARVFAEEKLEPTPRIRLTLSGFAEGLAADRLTRETTGIVRVQDANIEVRGAKADLLAGYARVTWGKLDEIQPTDVINPIDVSRFFFEGRSEARLPVLLVRGRVHPSESMSIEGVYVPGFRPGRFDRLDEATSPFNIATTVGRDLGSCLAIGCPTLPPSIENREPPFTWRNAQAGARVSATTGRIDWSVSMFRGIEPFGLYRLGSLTPLQAASGAPLPIVIEYPRFTMFGGDIEAVRGQWGVRGEVAAFVDDSFQSSDLQIVDGHSIDAGAGVDRRAGDYTVSATVLVHSESHVSTRSDVSLVMSLDRTFARERYRFRGFGVYNASESSGFLRGIGYANLRDNLGLEGSIGWFAGSGRDLVGRFSDSDFAYVRVKYYF
jgi:hypothetical protein